jgi:ribose/xylose/arabinose/galactoside ABC-type transport system permease subunit
VLGAALILGGANALELRVGEQPYIQGAFWGAIALIFLVVLGSELARDRGRVHIRAVSVTGLVVIAGVVLLITEPHISLSQPFWVGFPYVVALLVLAGSRTSARMPAALAVPYRRGQG